MEMNLPNSERFNLMEYTMDKIESLQDEGDGYYTGKFFGQPILLRYLGELNDNLNKTIEKYSYVNHKSLTINYGIVTERDEIKSTEKIYIIRELIDPFKNFYFITNFEHHNKLIVIYQIICLFEYLHSFGIYYKYLKPQKIFIYEDVRIKLLNLIQTDTLDREHIINGPLNDDIRFFCPDVYNPSVEDIDKPYIDIYTIGCHLFYAIYNDLPWKNHESKKDILKSYISGKVFLEEGSMNNGYFAEHDPYVVGIIKRCITNGYESMAELKEDFESIPEIVLFKYEKFREFDYEKGNIDIK
jgi:serine/threonine protein kinase